MKYDAFISYRHVPRDIAIAEKLHKLLESYRVPRHVRKMTGKKKISRVFRDRDELPLADNLSNNILTALDQSEFLLVICSPESKESIWVQREVSYFLQHHDRSHVLAILTSGEPDEAFLDLIRWEEKQVTLADGTVTTFREEVEPLAADVRGNSIKESLKILKQEKLRVLAALLGCEYNDLKQRQKEAMMRRALTLTSIILVVLSCFSLYAYRQNVKIKAEYTQKLISQGRNLANYSEQLLAQGDRDTAILLALEALPDGSQDASKPMVPEAFNSLSAAVYAYQTYGKGNYDFDKIITLQGKMDANGFQQCQLSPAGEYFAVLDESKILQIYTLSDAQLYQALAVEELEPAPMSQEGKNERFLFAGFLSEKELVLVTTHRILGLKTGTTDLLWSESFPEEIIRRGVYTIFDDAFAFSEDRTLLGACYEKHIYAFDLIRHDFVFLQTDVHQNTNCTVTFSPDKTSMLLASHVYGDGGTLPPEQMLRIADLKEGTVTSLDYDADYALHTSYLDEKNFLTLFIKGLSKSAITRRQQVSFSLARYDTETGAFQTLLTGESGFQPERPSRLMLCQATLDNGSKEDRIVGYVGARLFMLDGEGNVLSQVVTDCDITNLAYVRDNLFLVGLEDGTLARYNLLWDSSFPLYQLRRAENYDMAYFLYDSNHDTVLLVPRDASKCILCRRLYDTDYVPVEIAGDSKKWGYFFPEDSTDIYRYISTSDQLMVWKTDGAEGELLCSIPSQYHGTLTLYTYFRNEEGHLILCYYEEGTDEDNQEVLFFGAYDTVESRDLWTHLAEGRSMQLYGSPNSPFLISAYRNVFLLIDRVTGELIDPDPDGLYCGNQDPGDIYDVTFSGNGAYALFINRGWDENTTTVYRYRPEDDSWALIPGLENINEAYQRLVIDSSNSRMAYCKDGSSIDIYDLDTLEIIRQIPVNGRSHIKYLFLKNGRYMLYQSDDLHLRTWDLETDALVMEDTTGYTGVTSMQLQGDDYFSINAHQQRAHSLAIQAQFSSYVFWLNEDGTFSLYTEVPDSLFTVKGNEVLVTSPDFDHAIGAYPFYTLDQLIAKGRAIVGDKELTELERVKYYINNN